MPKTNAPTPESTGDPKVRVTSGSSASMTRGTAAKPSSTVGAKKQSAESRSAKASQLKAQSARSRADTTRATESEALKPGALKTDALKPDSSNSKSPTAELITLHALIERDYASLRRIARRRIAAAKSADSISPTSLVAESVIRLMKQRSLPQNSPHLCGLATILMAQAIAERSRLRRTQKRGCVQRPVLLKGDVTQDGRRTRISEQQDSIPTAELLRHLEALGESIPRTMEVVTLHLVLGIQLERVAEMLSISNRTACRELLLGRKRLAERFTRRAVR